MSSLLEGVRVIELSHVMAAPTCGIMLSDMGADVIKVERLPNGDDIRKLAPLVEGVSSPFVMMNRNKRGIAIDLKSSEGQAVLKDLIKDADILIENYRQGAVEAFGVGYEEVKQFNERLIYCSISGFGRTGPYSSKGGFDLVAQGMSGLMSVTGEGADRPPVKVGAPVTDITAGVLGAMGVLGALFKRGKTGKGQLVDTSLFEAGIMHTFWQSSIYFGSGEIPKAMGSAHPLMAPYQAFKTKDGWINVGSANQGLWEKLLIVLGAEKLLKEEKFSDPNRRLENLSELEELLTDFFGVEKTEVWIEKLEAAGIPAGPVLNIEEMSLDPQTIARRMVREVSNHGETFKVIGHPVKYSVYDTQIELSAPKLGEHTRDIMAELGYTEEKINLLLEKGAVYGGKKE
ncbi:MAG: CoA transferase [Rhodospirillaceae bacterium]|nr:CoA transferase [Rhodospirillaceae bacterium]